VHVQCTNSSASHEISQDREIANLIFIAKGNFVENVRARERKKQRDADARPLNDGLLLFSARHPYFFFFYVVGIMW